VKKNASPTSLLENRLKERGLTGAKLADMTGVPYSTIRRMLRAPSNPPLHAAMLVGRLLDAEVDELFATSQAVGAEG
jgi:transcriptional regulator with XRE-family HTH domain